MRFEQRSSGGENPKITPDNITTFYVPEVDGASEEVPALFDVHNPGEQPRLRYQSPRSKLVSEIERLVYATPEDQSANYDLPGGVRVSSIVEQRDGVILAMLSFQGLDLDKPWLSRRADPHQLDSGKTEVLAVTIRPDETITIDRSVMSPREATDETYSAAQFEAELKDLRRPIDEQTIRDTAYRLENISRFNDPGTFFAATSQMTGAADEASYRLGDTWVKVTNFKDPYTEAPSASLKVAQEVNGIRQLSELFSKQTPKEQRVVEYVLQEGIVTVWEGSGRAKKLQYNERQYIAGRDSSPGFVIPDDKVIWAVLRRIQNPRSEDERLT